MNLSLETVFWKRKAGGSLCRYWKQGQQAGALWGKPGAAPRQTQTVPGARSWRSWEWSKVEIGKKAGEESGIKECGWLSLKKKKKKGVEGNCFIFVYHHPSLLLNINK